MGRAAGVVIERSTVYKHRKANSFSVQVFTTDLMETDVLKKHFGGSTYKHLNGWYWWLTKRADQLVMLQKIRPFIEEQGKGRLEKLFEYFQALGVIVYEP